MSPLKVVGKMHISLPMGHGLVPWTLYISETSAGCLKHLYHQSLLTNWSDEGAGSSRVFTPNGGEK